MKINSLALIKIKFGLECIGVGENLDLFRIGGSTCDDIEKAFIAKTDDHNYYFNMGGYSDQGVSKLEIFESDEIAKKIVPDCAEFRRELWYYFQSPPNIMSPFVTELGDTEDTFDTFAILENGIWISRAWSVRRNEKSAEIAVETRESHRRKGYGSQVVSAWARSQMEKGKIGIYAHRKYNLESKYLAERVGATLFVDILSWQ